MSKSPKAMAGAGLLALLLAASAGSALADGYGLGREALPEEVAAWDIDVRPDGQGLPEGSGTVAEGEAIYAERCAACHGDFGEGRGRWPVLSGGRDTLKTQDPVKTVGSYWPYLSTVFDYVHRAMPYGDAQSLTADETYAVVAYILDLNFLMEGDALDRESFTEIVMPNQDGFFLAERPDTPTVDEKQPCMTNCKDEVEITMRARVLDVTPEGAKHAENTVTEDMSVGAPVGLEAEAESAKAASTAEAGASQVAAIDADLAAKGETLFNRCKSCHSVEPGVSRVGPSLHDIYGSKPGTADGFSRYSKAITGLDGVWDTESLSAFLENPRAYAKGTRMAFGGLRKEADRMALIEYLKSLSPSGS
mgnify:CR=1 FL=1